MDQPMSQNTNYDKPKVAQPAPIKQIDLVSAPVNKPAPSKPAGQ